MQELSLKNVKRLALKAYNAGLLMAQHPKAENRQCVYEDGKYHCGIGAALTKATLKAIAQDEDANGCSVESLHDKELVAFADWDEKELIEEVQMKHDAWAKMARNYGGRHRETIAARKVFVEFITA
jgi:hypothetical protein